MQLKKRTPEESRKLKEQLAEEYKNAKPKQRQTILISPSDYHLNENHLKMIEKSREPNKMSKEEMIARRRAGMTQEQKAQFKNILQLMAKTKPTTIDKAFDKIEKEQSLLTQEQKKYSFQNTSTTRKPTRSEELRETPVEAMRESAEALEMMLSKFKMQEKKNQE